jgi:hypothetical protein
VCKHFSHSLFRQLACIPRKQFTMEVILIEIPHGEDIVERIIQYAQHREANITVLNASGPVSGVTLHSPNLPIEGPVYMTNL